MIQEIHSFEAYEDFIREIAADADFRDPHFTYHESNLYRSLENPHARAYITTENGAVTGLFAWLLLPEEQYIELLVGLAKSESPFREMLTFLEKVHPHCQMDFILNPRNRAFRRVLEQKGAAFDAEQIKMRWERAVVPIRPHDILPLTPEWEEAYRARHERETYWTADKILAARDRFRVFIAVKGRELIGYIDVTYGYEENEPYALWVDEKYAGQGYEQSLLAVAVAQNASHDLIAFVEADDAAGIEIYRAAGFSAMAGQNHIYTTYHP